VSDAIVIVLAGLGTWALRASFIVFAAQRAMPSAVDRFLAYARPAMLGALLAGVMATRVDGVAVTLVPELAGLVAAVLAAWRTRNLAWTAASAIVVFAVAERALAGIERLL
jgi:branched-subunit amino acid transport protein